MKEFENYVAEDINDILDELDEQRVMIAKMSACIEDMSKVLVKLTKKVMDVDRKSVDVKSSREEELLKAFCKYYDASAMCNPLGWTLKHHIGMTEDEAYKYGGVSTAIW